MTFLCHTSLILLSTTNSAINMTLDGNDVQTGMEACTCKCKQHGCAHIVNTVLTYVKYSMVRANSECLIKVLNSTFTDDEMVGAKDVLWGVDGADKLLGKNQKRKDTDNRSKRSALCADVVEGMRKLDEGDKMPIFLCDPDGVGRIPTFSPEDFNVVTLDERCRELERQMRNMQHQLQLRTDAWSKVEDQVDHMESSMTQYAKHIRKLETGTDVNKKHVPNLGSPPLGQPTYANKLSSDNMQSKTPSAPPSVNPSRLMEASIGMVSGGSPTAAAASVAAIDDVTDSSVSTGAVSSKGTETTDGAQNQMLSGGFDYPKEYKNKLKRQQNKGISGTAACDSDIEFGAAEYVKLYKVFLTNVKNEVPLSVIKQWMSKKDISYIRIYRKSKMDYIHQSFVITVNSDTYDTIFNEALWPAGVKLRDYVPLTQRNNYE